MCVHTHAYARLHRASALYTHMYCAACVNVQRQLVRVLSFHLVSLGNQSHAVRVGSRCLPRQRHLSSLHLHILNKHLVLKFLV